jgi:hypothetical protein
MLRICCVKVNSAYDARYVNVLYDCVTRNLDEGTAGEFHCFTDNPEGLHPNIITHPVPSEFTGWWAKLHLFKDGHFEDGDRIVYIDLDTVIFGPLDDIVRYSGHFAILRDFFKPHNDMQSAIMAWPANTQQAILDKWVALGRPELQGGDQELIQMSLEERGIVPDFLQDLFPGKFVSYKSGSYKRVPPRGASVVCFHGQPKPHNCGSSWVDGVWKIDGSMAFEIEQFCNTEDAKVEANIKYAVSKGFPWLALKDAHERTAVICGGAPSLKNTWRDIWSCTDFDVFACNNTARFLEERGIDVAYHVVVDARPEIVEFIQPTAPRKGYLLGSMCDVGVFLAVNSGAVTVFHPKVKGVVELIENDPRAKCIVGGGSTVCLKAIAIAYIMGYRKFHLFGMDSSYSGDEHHAYPQSLNNDDPIVEVQVDDQYFKTSPWMVAQADEFDDLVCELLTLGCTFDISGDGLIPYICRDRVNSTKVCAADERAQAILSRLPRGEIRGAEIGVFAGDLSSRLLAREGLNLSMIDSWAPNGEDYAPGSDDFHASLTWDQQSKFMQMSIRATDFAKDRRTIIVMSSEAAAQNFTDGMLDFVFIDADHSYEGCKRDIAAWYPKLKDGALLSGHDYDHPEYPSWGVKRAVDEFAKSHGLSVDFGENMTWFINKPLAKEIAA